MRMNDSDKHTSFLWHIINKGCKKINGSLECVPFMEHCIETPVRTTGINSQFVNNNGKATINDIIIRAESEKY